MDRRYRFNDRSCLDVDRGTSCQKGHRHCPLRMAVTEDPMHHRFRPPGGGGGGKANSPPPSSAPPPPAPAGFFPSRPGILTVNVWPSLSE